MRSSTRFELGKLRELARHLLDGRVCYFCHEPLLLDRWMEKHQPGSSRGRPLDGIDITEHHIDLNHANNAMANRALAHGRCHRRFHLTLRHATRKAAILTKAEQADRLAASGT